MQRGTILYTKNGSIIGNAIVLKNIYAYGIQFIRIKTDFGNILNLTLGEIDAFFYTEYNSDIYFEQQSISHWMWAKFKLFFKF